MQLTGHYVIPVNVAVAWAALGDPEILRRCIEGCDMMERKAPSEFAFRAVRSFGGPSATFRGNIVLIDIDSPRRCMIRASDDGGDAGSVTGSADVRLLPRGNGTLLTYTADIHLDGKLAQLDDERAGRIARRLARSFFAHFAHRLAQRELETLEETFVGEPLPECAVAIDVARRDGLAPEVWVTGLVAVAMIALVLYEMF